MAGALPKPAQCRRVGKGAKRRAHHLSPHLCLVGTLRFAHPTAPFAWRTLAPTNIPPHSFTHHKEFFPETASQILP
ncbi:hypothetical protein ACVIW2_005695 [Bradyrhizobium huanghuaihaiense]|uniref:Uncharacterized protein n=1 Tax=Bradyrhizobium huanghuaihaiense TaxID=990078 RepID=A0A562S4Z1_9BRAD|nr:hypothetical protein IQ16_00588 [Bradyrhizobium huanghuaihaiense]